MLTLVLPRAPPPPALLPAIMAANAVSMPCITPKLVEEPVSCQRQFATPLSSTRPKSSSEDKVSERVHNRDATELREAS